MNKIYQLINKAICLAECLRPVVNLVIRCWIGNIFWKSGLTKITSWDKTLWLFANEYNVPLIPVNLAAILSTAVELSCPILLLFGLGTRAAALAMLGMTLVIEFTYDDNIEHYYWLLLLSMLISYGADKLSFDYLIKKKNSPKT
jgi:putative oxidoreductase